METIGLANAHCTVGITPEQGGRVVSLVSRASGVEHVGPNHLQTWLKRGTVPDPIAGMFHLFQGDFRTRTFAAARADADGAQQCELTARDGDIVFRKRYALAADRPVLTLTCAVENHGVAAVPLQFEHFFNWSFGPLTARRDVLTVIRHGNRLARHQSRPYGHACIEAFAGAGGGELAIIDFEHAETLVVRPDADWLRFTLMDSHGTSWRGPYSVERTLAPGASFAAAVELELVPGTAGEPASAPAAAPRGREPAPPRDGTDRPAAGAASPAFPLIVPAARPDFSVRSLHLIWSQQNAAGLSPDAIKWLLETVVAPCGFNQVVFEFNKALRLQSHPELAEPWAHPAAAVADLARFARGLGLDPVPQQNLYGHQNETNLTRAHPELQEKPGDLTVYCPSHPRTRQIVAAIVTELLDIFEPRFFHMGHDEVQFQGVGQRVGICPRCADREPAHVFAEDVAAIHGLAAQRGVRSMMWADLVIPPEFDRGNVNGGDGDVYRAIDLLPRDLVLVDWHYHPGEDYRSTAFFRQQGFAVLAAVSFLPQGIRQFAAYGRAAGVDGMMYTTWCRPDPTSLPLESLLYAAQCFQQVESADDPALAELLQERARQLWDQWVRWSAR